MGRNIYNVFDYLEWRGDLTFKQSEFNEIDALILSIFAYLDFTCVKSNTILFFQDAVTYINQLPNELKYKGPSIIMRFVVELANQAAQSSRFKDIGVLGYQSITDEVQEIQFAAITFLLADQTAFLSFRGTDNSLVGWKEDFNMCFIDGIPSQIEAAKYATKIAQQVNMPLRLGGHSKGGNLSIWASTQLLSNYKNAIIDIYSNDGPGFSTDFLQSDQYLDIKNKIRSFVPESSIVGVLMEHDEYTIIRSSNPSLLQHDPFSWLVQGTHFVYNDSRSFSGRQFERIISSWLRAMSKQEREELIESIYDIIISSNAKTLDDLDKKKIKSLLSMQKTFREMGIKKQSQLLLSISKVIFNSDLFINGNIFTLLSNNTEKN